MTTYGNQETDDWQQYVERLEFYFVANKITDAGQKRAIFLSACGGKVYAMLRDLCLPGKPGDSDFWLLKLLSDHFTPKPSAIVERFKFHSKTRQQGQSVSSFLAELK